MIRTPNRGVTISGLTLGSVGVAVAVLGALSVPAAQAAPKSQAAVQQATSSTSIVEVSSAATAARAAEAAGAAREARAAAAAREAVAAHRQALTRQAASAIVAVAGSTKKPVAKPHKAKPRASRAVKRRPLTPREVAQQLVAERGWKPAEFTCLNKLWNKESGWDPHLMNGSSGAYGIPQSLPASKMAAFGRDWRDNPVTQIRWGLWYIADRYGTPCAAWEHSIRYNYY